MSMFLIDCHIQGNIPQRKLISEQHILTSTCANLKICDQPKIGFEDNKELLLIVQGINTALYSIFSLELIYTG